jgi:hypothetical protein
MKVMVMDSDKTKTSKDNMTIRRTSLDSDGGLPVISLLKEQVLLALA